MNNQIERALHRFYLTHKKALSMQTRPQISAMSTAEQTFPTQIQFADNSTGE
jgi:hypothetical protein